MGSMAYDKENTHLDFERVAYIYVVLVSFPWTCCKHTFWHVVGSWSKTANRLVPGKLREGVGSRWFSSVGRLPVFRATHTTGLLMCRLSVIAVVMFMLCHIVAQLSVWFDESVKLLPTLIPCCFIVGIYFYDYIIYTIYIKHFRYFLACVCVLILYMGLWAEVK